MMWILLSLVLAVSAEQIKLKPGRTLEWKSENLNFGPQLAQPEQVHLSFGGDPSKMYVTWLTFNDTGDSFVDYGETELFGNRVMAEITSFRDSFLNSHKYTHRALIDGIKPGQKYYYRVGSQHAYSNIFSFTGLKERADGGYRFAVYGDFGLINARSLGLIQDQTQRNEFDMALHVGDFGYDMWWFDGDVGDKFFRTIEPIASRIPYMVIPGNHETWANFTQYKGRFTMPNTVDNTFYSFDLGPAHIIGYNTEIYYTLFSKHQLKTQWEWLIQDLEAANNNRDNVPWIIAMGHRPMYCSTNDEVSSSCGDPNNVVRVGLKGSHEFGLENLFYKYGVDLELYGHEHNYERMYPVFNNTVWKGVKAPYTDPPAPVHIVTGSAGCQENTDDFIKNPSPWSDVRSSDYGFSRMQIFNSSHLYFEQVRAYDGQIIDSFTLIKSKHGTYNNDQLNKYGHHVERPSTPHSDKDPNTY